MRIGMILDKTFPPDPRVENEALTLIANQFELHLFSLRYKSEPEYEQYKGIHIHRYKSNTWNYKLSALTYTIPFYTYLMVRHIDDFITKNAIEALHIHDIQIAQAVFKSNRKKGLKIILDLHENRPEIMKFYPHLQKFPGKWLIAPSMWKRKEEEFIKKSDKIVVVTEEAKSEICDRTGCAAQKVLVVPNTVSRNFGTHKIDDKASSAVKRYKNLFTILYIGDTGKRRGLSMVISSISLLKKSIEQIKLVIVGSSTFDNQLKDQVNALGLKDYVDFEGWQDESTFPDYIAASDVCVSPLHRNKHHDTTYANKIFQYMSMGKPVLVSDATAQKNIVEKHYTGLAHRAEDPDDFSKKLLKLFTNPELAKAFGERGMKFVNNEFYWEKTSQKLVDLYRNLYR